MTSEEGSIKRFFECLVPVTVCNLKCSYCYVIQRNYRNMKLANMQYTPDHIAKCLTKERLGGICYFSICGAGETLAQPEVLEIANGLLKNGHLVNITTNGTLTNRFKQLEKFAKEDLKRLHFSFSFHYLELKRLNLLDTFFNNIKYIKQLGCSFVVQLNLCDEYIPHIDDIKKICMENVNAYPQIAVTRDEAKSLRNIKILTELSADEYKKIGDTFNSPLFDYTMEKFNKKQSEFCYAGQRSGVLNLATGELKKCYGHSKSQNIFKDPNSIIKFEPIGNACRTRFCMNSSHFMSLGVMDNNEKVTYCGLRDREEAGWFNDVTRKCLSMKLSESNDSLGTKEQQSINRKERSLLYYEKVRGKVARIIRRRKKKNEPNT